MSRPSRARVGGFAIALLAVGYLVAGLYASSPAPGPQAVSTQTPSGSSPPSAASPQRALLDKYCVTCHNEQRKTAGLMLDKMDVGQIAAGAPVWEKVVRKLRASAMPPLGMPRPDKATYDDLATWLETELDRAAASAPNPGRPTIHRLNRTEYTNAIRDLLALEIDERLLPADSTGYGFDNIADVLSVSPTLLERYMSAAEKIGRLAIGDPTLRPGVATYRKPLTLLQDDRMSEELPFGSRGGFAVRHYFPLDGEYLIRFRLQRQKQQDIRGLDEENQIDIRLDGALLKRFTVGGKFKGPAAGVNGALQLTEQNIYEREADNGLEVRVPVKAGTRVLGVTFPKRTSAREGTGMARLPALTARFNEVKYNDDNDEGKLEMGIDSIEIAPPINIKAPEDTLSQRAIFVCRPTGKQDEEACAAKILTRLARRAYRRPVTDREVQALVGFYRAGRSKGSFELGVEWALEKILVSPDFLFRIERDPANVAAGTVYRISDLELASRLSFFLWSSIPDEELLDVAARGKLKDPVVLEQQVRRMLGDARATALVKNFGGQWLYLRNLRAMTPDPHAFPEFDESLREAFQLETELFLESQLREDRSVVDLLSANYTFLNERLARFYQIPNVYGNHFRRVTFPDDRRQGLLGHGSILTVTSYANRTSPVVRGKWLLENVLAAPPPAPPPNVPPLAENGEGGKPPTTVRERMEQHRRNPVCAACHARMDPLGFALENFDGIGQWRTISEANTPIDTSGVMPDGTKFSGPVEFRNALLSRSDQFVAAVVEKLLTYALGRGVEYYDMPAIRKIEREAAASNYRWSSLIISIARSMPFQMRTPPERGSVTNTSSQTRRAE